MRNLPPRRIVDATLDHALISDGWSSSRAARIERSIIGVRSRIGRNVVAQDCVLIGADRYETDEERAANRPRACRL